MAEYSIGVDLGGTNLRAAAVSRDGKIFDKISGKTELSAGRDAVISDMVDLIHELTKRGGRDRLAGVGIGVPGFILMEKGVILGSNNLPDFDGFPVRDEIERQLGTPIFLENDANAAALGEKWAGAGKDVDDLVLLTLGTGIGGGIISRGHVIHGHLGMAGEVGHMTIFPGGNPCGCGNSGCLEKHASATAIVSMARLIKLGDNLTASDVFEKSKAGDKRAKQIFATVGTALGIALATLINIFNFPLYLLSGGGLGGWEEFAPAMFHELERRSFTYRNARTRIDKAVLGNEAGLIGAAYLPFEPR